MTAALEAGREAQARALSSEREVWRRTYFVLAYAYLNAHPIGHQFTMEDFRVWAGQRGLGAPHHHNVWGAAARLILKDWFEDGRVVETGRRAGRTLRSHGQAFRVYRRVK